MAVFFYNLFIRFYYVAVQGASLFSKKAASWIDGRQQVHYKLNNYVNTAHGKRIWIHCASLGEFEQARPLIEKIAKEHPDHKLVLTFFSPSGFEARRYYEGVDYVCYLPLDTELDAKKFIRKLKPSLVIWVKYEYWYHMLHVLHVNKIPVVLISAVVRPDSIFFKWYGSLHRKMLGFFSHIFVQNQSSQDLLKSLGVASEVCADTRFDSVYNVMCNKKQFDNATNFKGDKKIFVAGSTWPKDIDVISEMIDNDPFGGQYKFIIAPHDVARKNIDYIIKNLGKKKILFSRITPQNIDKCEIMIVDSIGVLSSLYHYADITYVGGGFNASVHNILEPAVYGKPVIFGPHYQKSEEAKDLLSHPDWQAAHTVKNGAELIAVVKDLTANNDEKLKTGSKHSQEYVLSHRGGTDQIYAYLEEKKLL
jgi:3-deoxy-D-manno-octulosonic-acid transferase